MANIHLSTDGGKTNECTLYHKFLMLVDVGRYEDIRNQVRNLQESLPCRDKRRKKDIMHRLESLFTFLIKYVNEELTTTKYNAYNSSKIVLDMVIKSVHVYERLIPP